jgi:hypothetical protein
MVATEILVAPFTLKDVSLIFGPSTGVSFEFNASVSEVTFTPSTSTVEWKGLHANSYTDQSTPTWTVAVSFAQDWDTTNSLSSYLLANAGMHVPVVFKPKLAATPTFYATVILTPGPIGGAVDQVAVGTVTMGVGGAPSQTAPSFADVDDALDEGSAPVVD